MSSRTNGRQVKKPGVLRHVSLGADRVPAAPCDPRQRARRAGCRQQDQTGRIPASSRRRVPTRCPICPLHFTPHPLSDVPRIGSFGRPCDTVCHPRRRPSQEPTLDSGSRPLCMAGEQVLFQSASTLPQAFAALVKTRRVSAAHNYAPPLHVLRRSARAAGAKHADDRRFSMAHLSLAARKAAESGQRGSRRILRKRDRAAALQAQGFCS